MEKVKKEYKEALKSLVMNPAFIVIIILVAILSFGFTITNSSIGVDDTCLDRYYSGSEEYVATSMLTPGRWGAYFLYHILGIKEFTPFWTETMAVCLLVLWSIIWCTFLKKEIKTEGKKITEYIILATVLISFPLINECFIYQNSILSVILGNIFVSISAILIYEVLYHKNLKKSWIFVAIFLIILGISMYEACAQTYLLSVCMIGILICYQQKERIHWKQILKYILISIVLIGIAILVNSIIVKIMHQAGVPESEAAEKEINWGNYGIGESIQMMNTYINDATVKNMKYFPVSIFIVAVIMGFVMSAIQSYKRKNSFILLLFLGMVGANFAISILQLKSVLYRTCISWSLFVAVVFMMFYIYMKQYSITRNITIIVITLLVLQQSRYLNQMFYNDYIRYQRDLHIAYELIDDLETGYDISKPLVIMGTPKKSIGKDGSQVNSLSVLWWGKKAFEDNGYEFIKFLNSLGYHFYKPEDEQYEKGKIEALNMAHYPKEGSIKELEDCIIVNF